MLDKPALCALDSAHLCCSIQCHCSSCSARAAPYFATCNQMYHASAHGLTHRLTLRCIHYGTLHFSLPFKRLYLHGYFAFVYADVPCVCWRPQRLELEKAVSSHVSAGNQNQVLWTSTQCSSSQSHLSSPLSQDPISPPMYPIMLHKVSLYLQNHDALI